MAEPMAAEQVRIAVRMTQEIIVDALAALGHALPAGFVISDVEVGCPLSAGTYHPMASITVTIWPEERRS